MPQARMRHEFTLRAEPRAVAEHLAEPRNYIGLSPLVIEVRDIGRAGAAIRYTAVERFALPLGGHLDNAIDVTLALDDTDPTSLLVGGDVVSPGRVRLSYRYEIAPDAAGSRVIDSLQLRAPFGLLRFAASRARAVQLERACVLATRLETT
ncbi:hypothetical protein [Agromyces sp. GXQ0307]|uniref:hypothetical protein n=1 Tax=Agromyces sp. GXQ0307 TaxID=3377835 RepID=UPI00383B6175